MQLLKMFFLFFLRLTSNIDKSAETFLTVHAPPLQDLPPQDGVDQGEEEGGQQQTKLQAPEEGQRRRFD